MTKLWPYTLLTPSAFPHSVETLELLETHISWVILTGTFAYKIKKPVDLGFLDFTTLALRHHYCLRELELNRRFADALYLDVVAITGSRAEPVIGGDGEVLDYAVKMRQFDSHFLADELARRGALSDTLIKQMAQTLAGFHQQFPPASPDSTTSSVDRFFSAASQNFTQINEYRLQSHDATLLNTCTRWMKRQQRDNTEIMQSREQRGFIKECHGDCHLGNIAVLDGKITLFDCIEFNDAFRVMDTLAEAAFLTMDLQARNLDAQARLFLNSYLEYRDDYSGLPLFNMYRSYYATVRAKVDLLSAPASATIEVSKASHPNFCRYLKLAHSFTQKTKPILVLMHGLSGSGKSYLAERLLKGFNAIRIRSDVERKRLFGIPFEQSGREVKELYSSETSRRTFERLLILSGKVIASGFSCIVDATFLSRSSRYPFLEWAERTGMQVLIIDCQSDDATIVSRLNARSEQGDDPSDADVAIYQRQKRSAEPFSAIEQQHVISVQTDQADGLPELLEAINRLQADTTVE